MSRMKLNIMIRHTRLRGYLWRVEKLTTVTQDVGNPFQEESDNLLTLHTKDIANPDSAALVATQYEKGAHQSHVFMTALASYVQCTFLPAT